MRLSLRVVAAMNLLLMIILTVMFYVSRRAMKNDALDRASQTLEGAMVRVDNLMLSMEETAGNMYYSLQPRLSNPDTMYAYSRKIVELNPCVVGCAIAYKPDYFPNREPFIAYTHRNGSIHEKHQDTDDQLVVCKETFNIMPYWEQRWFTRTIEANVPLWLNPMEGIEAGLEPLVLYCLPLRDDAGTPVGVMTVGVSISLLSGMVFDTKPSPNSYCALIDSAGMFVVHPTGKNLMMPNAFNMPDESVRNVLKSVLSGETGYKPLSVGGLDFYVFYKPFKQADVPYRSMGRLGWSIALAISKDDIFGEYYKTFNDVMTIALGGMILLLLSCWGILFVRLRPLKMLTSRAHHIAQGHYDEHIPNTWNRDEIGSLQRNFIRMRRSLVSQIETMRQLNQSVEDRGMDLKLAYKQAKKADKMKTAFLRHMSNQIVTPAQSIDEDVETLLNKGDDMDNAKRQQLVEHIQQSGHDITQILNQVLNLSEEEMRKEVDHD